ncbi:hypothetical protein FHQ18_09205 [Deferribacter autotrophicus]|uniref:Uncharacterized protein n=1 Tax=Deferribacter autotrophicus TaxID=500465 RepID=A0A5A8F0G7_9BACT|nr:hypothetical protein [Deferribacter autotrophicus]KAA0257509.1 hypothetical protein FHQ18_09205 [Deferribacter autotrophicus]
MTIPTKKPEKLKRGVIKEELVLLTGDYIKALILNQFLFWTQRSNDFDKFIEEERERFLKEGKNIELQKNYGWIYKKSSELSQEILLGLSDSNIRSHIKTLIELNYLEERNNPIHSWDKTKQYRVNLKELIIDLWIYGYYLEDFKYDFQSIFLEYLQNLDFLEFLSQKFESLSTKIRFSDTKIRFSAIETRISILETRISIIEKQYHRLLTKTTNKENNNSLNTTAPNDNGSFDAEESLPSSHPKPSLETEKRTNKNQALQCNEDVTKCNDNVTKMKQKSNIEYKSIENKSLEKENNNTYAPNDKESFCAEENGTETQASIEKQNQEQPQKANQPETPSLEIQNDTENVDRNTTVNESDSVDCKIERESSARAAAGDGLVASEPADPPAGDKHRKIGTGLGNSNIANKKPKINFNFETEEWENITDKHIADWNEAFPACNVKVELKRMRLWLLANPHKRKKNYERFILNWLSKQQDRGGSKQLEANTSNGEKKVKYIIEPYKPERRKA